MRLICLSFLILISGCRSEKSVDTPFVEIKALLSRPEKYDGKRIRTRGVWFSWFENSNIRESQYTLITIDNYLRDLIDLDFDEAEISKSKSEREKFIAMFEAKNRWDYHVQQTLIDLDCEGIFTHSDKIGTGGYLNQLRVSHVYSYKHIEPTNKAPEPTRGTGVLLFFRSRWPRVAQLGR